MDLNSLSNSALRAHQDANFRRQLYMKKENATMTTPAPITPAEQFRADVMSTLAAMHTELSNLYIDIDAMQTDIAAMRAGLTQAAAKPQTPAGSTMQFTADSVTLDYMDGKPVYKMRGGQYTKFGVRVWPEKLKLMDIDTATLKPGPNPIAPINVIVEMAETTDDAGQKKLTARKVTGRA